MLIELETQAIFLKKQVERMPHESRHCQRRKVIFPLKFKKQLLSNAGIS